MAQRVSRLVTTLPHATTSVSEARRFVLAALTSWAVDRDVVDDIMLAASELVTNALEHGRDEVRLDLRHTEHGVVLSVGDHGAGMPVMTPVNVTAPRNRGLAIVNSLSTAWGWSRDEDLKWVWAEFPTRIGSTHPGRDGEVALSG